MWWFIGLIVLVAIIFGISLHEAFWGIVAVVAALCAVGWAFGTKPGRIFIKYGVILVGVFAGAILLYQGITDKTENGKKYEDDVRLCETNLSGFYLDKSTNHFRSYVQDCVGKAATDSKTREDFWWVKLGAGILLLCSAVIAYRGGQERPPRTKQPARKKK